MCDLRQAAMCNVRLYSQKRKYHKINKLMNFEKSIPDMKRTTNHRVYVTHIRTLRLEA